MRVSLMKAVTTSDMLSAQKMTRWNRKMHRWIAIAIAIPMIFVIVTGIFLQVRKPVDWIQPPSMTGAQKYQPTVVLQQVLENVKAVPEMQVSDWSDIKLLDLRPKKGIIKVRNFDEFETQVDAMTGEVLQSAQRRNDFVVKMHDFSAWNARLWLGLPIRLGFLAIFLTGVYLNIKMTPARVKQLPIWTLFKQKKHSESIQTKRKSLAVVGATSHSRSLNATTPSKKSSPGVEAIENIAEKNVAEKSAKDHRPKRLRLKASLMRYHYWLGWVVIVPWAFVIFSGLLLQVRYEVPWVMPVQQQGQGTVPQVEFVQVLETAKQSPDYGVQSWEDVWRVYVYPNKGITTIRAKNKEEMQIDSETSQVLQIATRRTDWLEDIHEGKWMDLNLWLFLPVHILSLFLWVTGTVVAYSR
ncbi:MAG: PepSY domain-containing protein [Cyanobacteria bacterium J06621_11]